MSNQPIADIVGLAIFIAAFIFSPAAAQVVGPYMVIVVAATIGASFKVARREKSSRWGAFWFFLRVVGLAVLLTAALAALLNAYRPDLEPRVTVAPIALLIGFLDWRVALSKVVAVLFSTLDRVGGGKGGAS